MKSYYRVMLGTKSVHAEDCFAGNFIGTDFGITQDLTKRLPDEWRAYPAHWYNRFPEFRD